MGFLDKLFPPPNIDKLMNKGDIEGLQRMLKNENWILRREAVVALRTLLEVVVENLDKNMPKSIEEFKQNLITGSDSGLYNAMDKIIKALKEAVTDNNVDVRREAIFALAKNGSKSGASIIVNMLSSEDPKQRHEAAVVMELCDKPPTWSIPARHWIDNIFYIENSINILKTVLKDENPEVRRAVIKVFIKGGTYRDQFMYDALNDNAVSFLVADHLKKHATTKNMVAEFLKSHTITKPLTIDEAVDQLLMIYLQYPKGFEKGKDTLAAKQVESIGQALYEQGGMELMKSVHEDFARRCNIYGAPRNLEFMWDGIGTWQG